jgi:hypothetical protein
LVDGEATLRTDGGFTIVASFVDGESTLRTDGGFTILLGAASVLVVGVGASGGGWLTLVSSWVISRSTLLWVSVSGVSGDCGDGFWRATTISLRQAIMVAVEELSGMATLVGYHVTVSQRRMARVSQKR